MTFNVRMEVKNNTFPPDMKYAIVGIVCQVVFSKNSQNNNNKISTIIFDSLKEAYPEYSFQVLCVERDSNYNFLGEMSFNCTIQINYNAYIIGAIKSETTKKARVNILSENDLASEEDINSETLNINYKKNLNFNSIKNNIK